MRQVWLPMFPDSNREAEVCRSVSPCHTQLYVTVPGLITGFKLVHLVLKAKEWFRHSDSAREGAPGQVAVLSSESTSVAPTYTLVLGQGLCGGRKSPPSAGSAHVPSCVLYNQRGGLFSPHYR